MHLPDEGHDFGINKRKAVYDFLLPSSRWIKRKSEKKVTIEPEEDLKIFGRNGELLPENAIRSFEELSVYFDKNGTPNFSPICRSKESHRMGCFFKFGNQTDAAF